MAFKNFPKEMYVKVQETGAINGLGSIQLDRDVTLRYIRMPIYIHNVSSLGGSETLQLKLYSDSDLSKEYSASNVLTVSTFATGSTSWIGYIGFEFSDFPNIGISPLHVGLIASNYTRSGDAFYIAVQYDWPLKVNQGGNGTALELYGYQDRDGI